MNTPTTDREVQILDAAFQVFLRYGVQRSGMNDIAKEAGFARQTLYNAYPNKDAVLRAMIRQFANQAIAQITAEFENEEDVGKRLDIIFREIALNPYAKLHSSPHAEDFIQGMNAASHAEIAESYERFRAVIEEVLAPLEETLSEAGITPHQLSELIQTTATAAKYKARDEAHLREMLTALRNWTLVLTR